MKTAFVDFETFYSDFFSLTKLTTEEYCRAADFEVIGFSIKIDQGETKWYSGDKAFIKAKLDAHALHEFASCSHNAIFDMAILHWHFDIRPRFIFDTLSMARALHGDEIGNSLTKLSHHYGLGEKGFEVLNAKGKRRLDFTPHELSAYGGYCCNDTELCAKLFHKMLPQFPPSELMLIDQTVRMFTEPTIVLDVPLLEAYQKEEQDKLRALLGKTGVTEKELASNPKFSALLAQFGVAVPMKNSPKRKNPDGSPMKMPALAKNDAGFQALLASENEDVALLSEARLGAKSTIGRTRAGRFLSIASRGTMPVPLKYWGAGPGRWSGSERINLQNLKRGSKLRQSMIAPEGYAFCAPDLSQIEPRVLSWLAEDFNMLAILQQGDPYAIFGAQMFDTPGMTKESHPLLRQSAKSGMLGCFGPMTKVLTQRGWVSIVSVLATDTVWDGIEWVKHQGVVQQGVKEVQTALGLSATSEHEILTGHGWLGWGEVHTNHSLIQQALSLANLPLLSGSVLPAQSRCATSMSFSRGAVVAADGRGLLIEQTCGAEEPNDAIHAQKRKQQKREWRKPGMKWCAPPQHIEKDYKTESAQLFRVALTRTIRYTQTMVEGVSRYIRHGSAIGCCFSSTYSLSTGGINQNSNWIEKTTQKGTSQGTCVSAHKQSTMQTEGLPRKGGNCSLSKSKSSCSKQKMQTYDLAFAGPRNRYTVLTDEGPIIVHNCGYGLGHVNFAAQLLTGFLGAPPIRYDMAFLEQTGLGAWYVKDLMLDRKWLKQVLALPHTCKDVDLIVHTAAAKAIVDKYRVAAAPVKNFWKTCAGFIECMYVGRESAYKNLLVFKERIQLPNGMSLRYNNLRPQTVEEVDEDGVITKKEEWVYGQPGKERRIYGAKLTENITQALARIVMSDGMLRIGKRYRNVLTVHDEVVSLVPEQEAPIAAAWMQQQMTIEPSYMPGIPLAASAPYGKNYGECK